jgi:hypothetical protein
VDWEEIIAEASSNRPTYIQFPDPVKRIAGLTEPTFAPGYLRAAIPIPCRTFSASENFHAAQPLWSLAGGSWVPESLFESMNVDLVSPRVRKEGMHQRE